MRLSEKWAALPIGYHARRLTLGVSSPLFLPAVFSALYMVLRENPTITEDDHVQNIARFKDKGKRGTEGVADWPEEFEVGRGRD